MKKVFLLVLIALPGICYAIEETDTLKCQKGTVKIGSNKTAVVAMCGEPSSKNPTPAPNLTMGKKTFRATEEWAYRFGGHDYVVMLNGDLVVKLFKEQRK